MQNSQSATPDSPQLSFFQNLSVGLKVILSEIHWNILKGLRSWEIRQLSKRLDREYQTAGKLTLAEGQGKENESEMELCQNQIQFLEKEIDFLKQELQSLRQNKIKKRREKWGI